MFDYALRFLNAIANSAAESITYNENWGNDFSIKNIKNMFEYIKEDLTAEKYKAILELPVEQRLQLGFKSYSKDYPNKLLIPLWVIQIMPDNFDIEVTSIFGEKCSIKNINKDIRFGCVAYMI